MPGQNMHVPPPYLTRLKHVITLTALWAVMGSWRWFTSLVSRPKPRPTLIRTYKAGLPIHVFIPSNSSVTKLLPVLFTVHGGAFTIGDPSDDDELNHALASKYNLAVISLNYRKFPLARHPDSLDDLELLVLAALADESLSLDRNRVAITGISSGAGLALGLCQRLAAVSKIYVSAVVVRHGAIDFTTAPPAMESTRPYKPALGGMRGSSSDFGVGLNQAFKWLYAPYDIDMRDPVLSPAWANRESLPPRIFFIQAELDILLGENWRMACRLAGREVPALDEMGGRLEPWGLQGADAICDVLKGRAPFGADVWTEEDSELFSWEDEASGVRWLLVPDVLHGFEIGFPKYMLDEATEADARAKREVITQEIGEWLWKGWER